MIIYEILYTWCLRYSIWSAWHLDIRIATCFYKINDIKNYYSSNFEFDINLSSKIADSHVL